MHQLCHGEKTKDEIQRLEWYDIPKDFNPEECDLEWLQDNVESLWLEMKDEMKEEMKRK